MMAQGGVKGFAKELGVAALAFAPLLLPLAVGAGLFAAFMHEVQQDDALKSYANSLGLTKKEMKELGDVGITTGDKLAGLWTTIEQETGLDKLFDGVGDKAGKAIHAVYEWFVWGGAGMSAAIRACYDTILATWRDFPGAFGSLIIQGVNAAAQGVAWLVNKSIDGINTVTHLAIGHVDFGTIANPYAKAGQHVADTYAQSFRKRLSEAQTENDQFMAAWGRNTLSHAEARVKKQADDIRGDHKPKVDHHAEQLARDAAAVEAQIGNLYKLADAYGVSGAAALIAEARVKAESEAIKKRGDIEEMVARQVRLAVAERVKAAAQSAATLNDQAAEQERVNAEVAAGLIPAAQANDIMQQRLALLPVLQAQEAARLVGDKVGYAAATAELATLTAAQTRANAAKREAQFLADQTAGANQLAQLRLEAQLISATDAARVHALATLKATQEAEAKFTDPGQRAAYIAQQVEIAATTERTQRAQDAYNQSLRLTADRWDIIAGRVQAAGEGMADAFGNAGKAIGDMANIYVQYQATRARLDAERQAVVEKYGADSRQAEIANQVYALQTSGLQIDAFRQAAGAAKSMFAEHSAGYEVMAATEKALAAWRAVQAVRDVAAGAAKMFASLGPFGFAAVAAMVAVMAGFGISGGGGSTVKPSADDIQKAAGTGSVLGSVDGKSASISHSLDLVAKNTDGLLAFSNPMLAALKTINTSIGTMTAAVAKQIGVSGSFTDTSKLNIGSSGSSGILGLFSSSTTRTLYDAGITLAATTVGDIVAQGISGQTYQIVQQVRKSSGFLGIGGGTKTTYQTTNGGLPSDVTDSIRSVIGALESGIVTAAGQIGVTGAKAMLDNFQVAIGTLSFNGLDAQGIADELNAVFSKVGDQMVEAILPEVRQFQRAGEGLFETLERVASTVAVVNAEFRKMGVDTTGLGIAIDVAIAGLFDSVSDFTSAADAYFKTYYSAADQAKAQAADMQAVFDTLGIGMPATLASFRALVEAQDLTTAAGQSTYATLLKIAPAFADLQATLNGAKSAADALSEREGLLNQLWQLQGDTAAIRAAQLATIDPSNRALQQQVWALSDAQDAAKNAKDLADAWTSVGTSIMDEVKRIRGLTDPTGDGSFATLMGQFNAATAAARGGDQDAAKSLPSLSQAMLAAAANVATSRQELLRVQAETAASLQATYGVVSALAHAGTTTSASGTAAVVAAAVAQGSTATTAATDNTAAEIAALRDELAGMRRDNNAGHAANASANNRSAKVLEAVSHQSGGEAVTVANAA